MASKKHSHHEETASPVRTAHQPSRVPGTAPRRKLEIVLKCDSFGSCEAVPEILTKKKSPDVDIKFIHSGVGQISKSDLLMALTGSKLVIGFNVGAMPKLDQWMKENGVEVRLYDVIYRLAEDLETIAQSLIPREGPEEKVTGRAKVIALFKSSHRGIILGCEVLEGTLAVGKRFRVIAAMGPVYSGKIESLQIEQRSVNEATKGRQVGLKISDFNQGKVGDLVECFQPAPAQKSLPWKPSGNILHFAVKSGTSSH